MRQRTINEHLLVSQNLLLTDAAKL